MRLMHVLVVFLAAAHGCDATAAPPVGSELQQPTEQELLAEFDSFVSDHADCERDEDCVMFSPGCPLGCYAAVHVDALQEAESYADGLVADYMAPGRACFYQCVVECGVRCADNICATVYDCSP